MHELNNKHYPQDKLALQLDVSLVLPSTLGGQKKEKHTQKNRPWLNENLTLHDDPRATRLTQQENESMMSILGVLKSSILLMDSGVTEFACHV